MSSPALQMSFEARVQFTLAVALREGYVASDFLHSISGKVLACCGDEREVRAGYITASLVQFGRAMDNGVTPDQLGDGLSGDIAGCWEHLFDVETGKWKAAIQELFEIVGDDLLVIDCIEIHPVSGGIRLVYRLLIGPSTFSDRVAG